MAVVSPAEVFRAVTKVLIILCVAQVILSPVNAKRKNGAEDVCSGRSACIPKDDCPKSKRVDKCGDGKVCCKDNENRGKKKVGGYTKLKKENNGKNTKRKDIDTKRNTNKFGKRGEKRIKKISDKNGRNSKKEINAIKLKKINTNNRVKPVNIIKGDKKKVGNNNSNETKTKKGRKSGSSTKRKKKNGKKIKQNIDQSKINRKRKQKPELRKGNKNDKTPAKRKKQNGSNGSKNEKSKNKTKCTNTDACKALGGTCGKKGSCSTKDKSKVKDKNKGKGKPKSEVNRKGKITQKKKNKGKLGTCGLFCECCLPEPCHYYPSTPACDKRGGTCMMRADCDYKTSKDIITDECDRQGPRCFECCSSNDIVVPPCSPPRGKCKKRKGTCIKKGEFCPPTFDRFQQGCKRKEDCECCAPPENKKCHKKCKCKNGENGKCKNKCTGRLEDSLAGCSHKKENCDNCKCCVQKPKKCKPKGNKCQNIDGVKGDCERRQSCPSNTELIPKACKPKDCTCCVPKSIFDCDPKTCTFNGQDGECSFTPITGSDDVGTQQCKGGCTCYVPVPPTCDPLTCTFNNTQGNCSLTPIVGYTDQGPQQCKGGCNCYTMDNVPPTCDPLTCTFNNTQGNCSSTPIVGYTDQGPQQCKGGCNCYTMDDAGVKIGDLSQLAHAVKGEVFAVDSRTIRIRGFTYDGTGPETFFYAGTSGQPSNRGFLIPDEKGTKNVLGAYRNKDVTLILPVGQTLKDIAWFSIWCRFFSINFGHVMIPARLSVPNR